MGVFQTVVFWSGWLAVAAGAVSALLYLTSLAARLTTRSSLVNLQSDSEFFAGAAMVVALLLVILFLLLATGGFAWTVWRPSPAHLFYARMIRFGLIGLAVALVGGFLSITVFRGGILPH